MPYDRSTLTALRSQARTDVAESATGGKQVPRFSILGLLADEAAGLAHEQYGYLDWISLQAVPFTAQDEYLLGWAALKGITQNPATAATCPSVQWSGAVTDTPLPAGTLVVRGDGVEYTTVADATVNGGGVVTAEIEAVADPLGLTGAFGNAPAGTVLTLGASIGGIPSSGVAVDPITGGSDLETLDSLRTRMLERYQNPPQGGSVTDYLEWTGAVPGVTRKWVIPNAIGNGTVYVYVMFDVAEAGTGGFPVGSDGVSASEPRGTPATGDQLTVADALYPLQPVGPIVTVLAPGDHPVDVTISGLTALSTGTKAQITAAIGGAIVRTASVAQSVKADGTVNSGLIAISDLEAAVLALAGGTPFLITAPAGNVTPAAGYLCTPGTVTYI